MRIIKYIVGEQILLPILVFYPFENVTLFIFLFVYVWFGISFIAKYKYAVVKKGYSCVILRVRLCLYIH